MMTRRGYLIVTPKCPLAALIGVPSRESNLALKLQKPFMLCLTRPTPCLLATAAPRARPAACLRSLMLTG